MAEEGIITYDKLYEVLRLEKYKQELQKLDSDFYSKVVRYLDEKKSILESQEKKDSVFASASIAKTKRQLENTRMILKELYERREGKVIQMALFSSRTNENVQEVDALLGDELKLYNSLIELFDNYRKDILFNILEGKGPIVEKEKLETKKTVKFLESVPKFIGEDMNVYGPYKAEDTARLPEKVSQILLENKRVKEV